MSCMADLAGRFVLSTLVGMGSSLGEEYNKQDCQSEGQHSGDVPYGFSPKSHSPTNFTSASHWTRRPCRGKQPLNPSPVYRHLPDLLYSLIVSRGRMGATDGSYQTGQRETLKPPLNSRTRKTLPEGC